MVRMYKIGPATYASERAMQRRAERQRKRRSSSSSKTTLYKIATVQADGSVKVTTHTKKVSLGMNQYRVDDGRFKIGYRTYYTPDAAGRKASSEDIRAERQSIMEANKRIRQQAKEQRLSQISKLKSAQLEYLDKEIAKIPTGKRFSPRFATKYKEQEAKLRAIKKDLSIGEGEEWYSKVQRYLEPTSDKLNQMSRRLASRPRLAR